MRPFSSIVEVAVAILLFRCGFDWAFEGGEGGVLGVVMLVIGGFSTYFYPSWLAMHRKVASVEMIVRTNAMYGWTVVGWFIALYWALTDPVRSATRNYRAAKP